MNVTSIRRNFFFLKNSSHIPLIAVLLTVSLLSSNCTTTTDATANNTGSKEELFTIEATLSDQVVSNISIAATTVTISGLTNVDGTPAGTLVITPAVPNISINERLLRFTAPPGITNAILSNVATFVLIDTVTQATTTYTVVLHFLGRPVNEIIETASFNAIYNSRTGRVVLEKETQEITISDLFNENDQNSNAGSLAVTVPPGYVATSLPIEDPAGTNAASLLLGELTIAEGSIDAPVNGNIASYRVQAVFMGLNAPFHVIDIAVVFNNEPISISDIELRNNKVIITGLTNADDFLNAELNLNITERPSFSVNSPSVTIADPPGRSSHTRLQPQAFTITPTTSPTQQPVPYTVEVKFVSAHVTDVITPTLFTVTFDNKPGTVTRSERPNTIIVAVKNVPEGIEGVMNLNLPRGYVSQGFPYPIHDNDGLAIGPTNAAFAFRVAEGTNLSAPVDNNIAQFTVIIYYREVALIPNDNTPPNDRTYTFSSGYNSLTITNNACHPTYSPPTRFAITVDGMLDANYNIGTVTAPATINPYYDKITPANNTNTQVIQVTEPAIGPIEYRISTVIIDCNLAAFLGDGSASSPWIIDNDIKLAYVARLINTPSSPGDPDNLRAYASATYMLTENINLGNTLAPWSENSSHPNPEPNGFTPIGTTLTTIATDLSEHTNRFTGTFNCNQKIISNLFINNTRTNNNETNKGYFEGLFGILDINGLISDCVLSNAKVTGHQYTGGLVGYQNGGMITTSYVNGTIAGANSTGGLVGYQNGGIIANVYAQGSVTGNDYLGGLVGQHATGTMSNAYATSSVTTTSGSYVGGLIGSVTANPNTGTISYTYATGRVTGNNNAGGLIGNVVGTRTDAVVHSYWDMTTTDQSTSAAGTGKSTADLTNAANPGTMPTDTYYNWDVNSWNFPGNNYPHLINVACPNHQHKTAIPSTCESF